MAEGGSQPNCAICQQQIINCCFVGTCCHEFCYECLVTWSKEKTECPLCKRLFTSIIHNVIEMDQYDVHHIEPHNLSTDYDDSSLLVIAGNSQDSNTSVITLRNMLNNSGGSQETTSSILSASVGELVAEIESTDRQDRERLIGQFHVVTSAAGTRISVYELSLPNTEDESVNHSWPTLESIESHENVTNESIEELLPNTEDESASHDWPTWESFESHENVTNESIEESLSNTADERVNDTLSTLESIASLGNVTYASIEESLPNIEDESVNHSWPTLESIESHENVTKESIEESLPNTEDDSGSHGWPTLEGSESHDVTYESIKDTDESADENSSASGDDYASIEEKETGIDNTDENVYLSSSHYTIEDTDDDEDGRSVSYTSIITIEDD